MQASAVKIFKALADSTRIDIVHKLTKHKKEVSCKELMKKFPLSQPTLSHHFNKLIDAQILKVRKDGARHFYSVNKTYLNKLGVNIQRL